MAPDNGCAQCGAVGCEERYYSFLAREFVDAGYGAVHHLTVAAYMVQHPARLSQEGWRAMRDTLRAFVAEGRSPQEQRAAMRDLAAGEKRAWSITKGPRQTLPPGFRWSSDITAVDDSDAATYCRDIEAWARQVLADAEAIP